ncbi:hypothetical protein [Mariniflexile maritimum]|jgi:hypothetical protein|uniref:hypothetical protein n=1 Tax=Mariniflexile maritimum TaxID=2682493 RepID=UPI0012F6BAD6|nr:hypothetical protein [Mariniflexile maritimum]
MKLFLSFLVFCSITLALNAQIDSQKKSMAIPAVESKKETNETQKTIPAQPLNNNTNFGSLNVPNLSTGVEAPKKEFSLFGEAFGNPGELYQKQLKKQEDDLKPEGFGDNAGLKTDAYWGDYRTKSEYIDISYRDFGQVDGDLLNILVDDDILRSSELLMASFKGFRLRLKEGLNKIEFYAVNEGSLLPNTAEYRIVDQWKNVITGKIWALATGVKVTIIIVKE